MKRRVHSYLAAEFNCLLDVDEIVEFCRDKSLLGIKGDYHDQRLAAMRKNALETGAGIDSEPFLSLERSRREGKCFSVHLQIEGNLGLDGQLRKEGALLRSDKFSADEIRAATSVRNLLKGLDGLGVLVKSEINSG